MKQTSYLYLYLATLGLGCLFPVGILVIGLLLLPGSGYLYSCVIIGILLVIPLSLLGALLGKILTKTGMGAWMEALVIVFLGIVWLSSNYCYH